MADIAGRRFQIVCEVDPPVTPELDTVRDQIASLATVCDALLVPDNHLGRATVSSVAVASEAARLGIRAFACLNARDRNLLGLHRDAVTAAAYGVEGLLFVYGDAPSRGDRSSTTVRQMLGEVPELDPQLVVGVAADVSRPLPPWKHPADFVCTQISCDPEAVVGWRERSGFDGRVYAGVVVLASRGMAERLAGVIPGFEVPERIRRLLDRDRTAGVKLAVEQLHVLRDLGHVDGAHLVPARRHREVVDALTDTDLVPGTITFDRHTPAAVT